MRMCSTYLSTSRPPQWSPLGHLCGGSWRPPPLWWVDALHMCKMHTRKQRMYAVFAFSHNAYFIISPLCRSWRCSFGGIHIPERCWKASGQLYSASARTEPAANCTTVIPAARSTLMSRGYILQRTVLSKLSAQHSHFLDVACIPR